MEDRGILASPAHEAYVQAYEWYVSHLMSCTKCYAPKVRYCEVGELRRLESDSSYLMTVTDVTERKRLMRLDHAKNPAYAQLLKARVIELFNEDR